LYLNIYIGFLFSNGKDIQILYRDRYNGLDPVRVRSFTIARPFGRPTYARTVLARDF